MELKDRIREAMESAKLKPLQLANSCGVSSGAVTHWLNGATKALKAETANRMQQVTGYNANWIITGLGERMASAGAAPIPYFGPTPLGRELALLFDMIPEGDHLMRAKAYSLATSAIVAVLQGENVVLQRESDK